MSTRDNDVDDGPLRSERRHRHRWPVAIAAVVAAVAVGILLGTRADHEPDQVVASEVDDQQSPTAAPTQEPEPEPDPAASEEAASATVGSEVAAMSVEATGDGWLVAWQDGFLHITQAYGDPGYNADAAAEFASLFPPEIVALFAGSPPATLTEAQAIIAEGGYTEVVQEILAENPEVLSSLYVPPAATVSARYSADGNAWEPIHMAMPAPGQLAAVASDGSRLVVALAPLTPTDTSTVAISEDLTTWTETELPQPPDPDLPDIVMTSGGINTLLVNDAGWLLVQTEHLHIDFDALPEAETSANGGVAVSTDPDGVRVDWYGDDEDEPLRSITYTWDELGVSPDLADRLNGPPEATVIFGAWDAEPTLAILPRDTRGYGAAATDDAFAMPIQSRFGASNAIAISVDGQTWATKEVDGVLFVQSVIGAGDQLLVVGTVDDATRVVRSGDLGATWTPTDPPGLAGNWSLSTPGQAGTGGFAGVVEVYPSFPGAGIEPGPVVVLHDGFEITSTFDDESMRVTIVEQSTGTTVLDGEHRYPTPAEVAGFESEAEAEAAATPDWLQHGRDSFTYVDPDTGAHIVTVPHDKWNQAHEEAWDAALAEAGVDPNEPQHTRPEVSLIATLDGEQWLIERVDVDQPWPVAAAINGTRMVAMVGDQTYTADLG